MRRCVRRARAARGAAFTASGRRQRVELKVWATPQPGTILIQAQERGRKILEGARENALKRAEAARDPTTPCVAGIAATLAPVVVSLSCAVRSRE